MSGVRGSDGPEPLNVGQMTLSLSPGGRRAAILTLASALRGQAVRSDLVTLDSRHDDLEGARAALSDHLALERKRMLDPDAFRRLAGYCRARDHAILHVHDAASELTAALLRLIRPGLRIVSTFHRTLGIDTTSVRNRFRNAFTLAWVSAVITGSRERQAYFLRENLVRGRKVVRIPFGIDIGRFRPDGEARRAIRAELGLAEGALVLGAAGHFGREKGIDVVLEGYAILVGRLQHEAPPLIVLGTGAPEREGYLRERAATAPGRVIFLGFRRDVERCLAALDIFIHLPRAEAFGLVLAEAAATGLPVIASSVGGVPDVVREEETGLLVPPESPEAFADAAEHMLRDEGLRRRLASAALSLAREELSSALFARRHRQLYDDVLARRQPFGAKKAGPLWRDPPRS
jgi:L-malate glycosyltransferase